MSECEDMTTLMAKELMLGIKDSVRMFPPCSSAWQISTSGRRMVYFRGGPHRPG